MTRLTDEQVEELKTKIYPYILTSLGEEPDQDYVEDYFRDLLLWPRGSNTKEGLTFISQEGGGEGGAEHCESVFKFEDTYYKVIYSYASYEGYDLDYAQWYIVTPKEKTITVYE